MAGDQGCHQCPNTASCRTRYTWTSTEHRLIRLLAHQPTNPNPNRWLISNRHRFSAVPRKTSGLLSHLSMAALVGENERLVAGMLAFITGPAALQAGRQRDTAKWLNTSNNELARSLNQ